MSSLRRTGVCLLIAAIGIAGATSPAWAGSRQAQVRIDRFLSLFPADAHPDPVCRLYVGPVFGLCNAFCKHQNCDERPSSTSCDILRQMFKQLTRKDTFPCEGAAPPAPTRTSTSTRTATQPAGTPTATATHTLAVPTGTVATVTATSEIATPTPTNTLAVPTGTTSATATEAPTATPTETLAVPTGTASATVSPTDTPTPPPAVETPTNTPQPDNTSTPTPTGVPPTFTQTQVPFTQTQAPSFTPTASPTPSETPGLPCPLESGSYTLTQTEGGSLRVSGLAPFPFPAGGEVVQDVAEASQPDCVHETVVPFPGGFDAPVFCIPALQFTVAVEQTGCGIGRIDSNGGSDFTITEVGDTSSPTQCGFDQGASCANGANANVQVDITVGDGSDDTCANGSANAVVSIPVFTTTWQDQLFACPDTDGVFDQGADTLIVSFPQVLDFTTDATSADFDDLDADGCCIAGSGPASKINPCTAGGAGPQTATGTCINLLGVDAPGADVTTVAAGPVGSNGSPLFDLTFRTTLPNEISIGGDFAGLTCDTPPTIDFGGTATRCINPSAAAASGSSAARTHPKIRKRYLNALSAD
jgi:hypothetical protein